MTSVNVLHISQSEIEEPFIPEYLRGTAFAEQYETRYISFSRHGRNFGIGSDFSELPSSWNEDDKCNLLSLAGNGLEVKFVGPAKGVEQDAASVRANNPIPTRCGLYYYEIEILSKGYEGLIGIGFCKSTVPLNRLPGWESDSWGYHGDDGHSFCCQGIGKEYGPKFTKGDIIGCGINFSSGIGFYTKNGVHLGVAFRDLKGTLYPSVGLRTLGEHIRANFGKKPFVFDIEQYMRMEKSKAFESINSWPSSEDKEYSESSISTIVNNLVASYLSHNGYMESAKTFIQDVENREKIFASMDKDYILESIDIDDIDSVNRQHIRVAILNGDIDLALKLTNIFYPGLLETNESVYFKLKCHKFIEMMRQCSESGNENDDEIMTDITGVYDNDNVSCFDSLENSSIEPRNLKKKNTRFLLSKILEYGQQLQKDYRDDNRSDIRKTLEDTFSLLAYSNPKNSAVSYLLDENARQVVAEELNKAILVFLGKSPISPLERLVQYTSVVISELGKKGSSESSFVNIRQDILGI
ncbi:hypothetical protein T552_00635 [Pneumocystis carinii B80]|uniref:Protein SSH4 n=1 Tax=Pneumocystis carinii (strain B80) TaxID=1408658 RepID=A0A0W4ZP42_PNEC8|nr:hypothetical protein T552_00635 [Pneumocystis carinii B80]KTW30156.1 hypothetical protein T552_00635 [Pneumocystis carinii B80]